ncbi:MAG: hypothetical protein IT196_23795 [Acidimicrobiales bacterium]|nr:hypothetical protein [Acidimicrobiales bacterium]
MTPQELVSAACPKIGSLGAKFYFHPDTVATGKAHNLDGFRFYFLGRGGVLGDVEAPVIKSAFGYFAAPLVAKIWTSAKERMAPREAARLYLQCNADLARKTIADVADLDAFCTAAEAVVAAVEPAGLALFAGVAAEPLPEDLPARALQLVAVLREFRGSAHLLAVVASGLDPAVAHAIKRPDDVGTFGYAEAPTATDADRAKLDAAERLTDELVLPAYSVLDAAAATTMVTVLEAMEARLG